MKPIKPIGLPKISGIFAKTKIKNLGTLKQIPFDKLDWGNMRSASTKTAKACFLSDLFEKLFKHN